MMISDEPDEDADNLDDDTLLANGLGVMPNAPAPKADNGTGVPDWPSSGLAGRSISLDTDTIEWFQRNHDDWYGQIQAVLRAWIEAHTNKAQPKGR